MQCPRARFKIASALRAAALCWLATMAIAGHAATVVWTGSAGNGSWSVGANWQGGAPPISGTDTLVFSGITQTTTANGSPFTTGSGTAITFANDGTAGRDASFTISGSPVTLMGSISTTATTSGILTDTIAADLVVGSQRGFATNGGHGLAVTGIVSSVGGINKSGTGLLTLSALNTFTGAVNVFQGTIAVESIGATTHAGGLGQNTSFRLGNAAANAAVTHTGTTESTDKRVQIGNGVAGTASGGGTINANGTGALTFTNATFTVADSTATTARTLTLGGIASSGTSTIKGVIADNSVTAAIGLVKTGAGTWRLDGANTFSGPVEVDNGSLVVSSLGATGAASNVGTNGLIRLGSGNSNGQLILVGLGGSSDKQVRVGGGAELSAAGDATITSNGSGATTFTNAVFNTPDAAATATRVLTLGGSASSGTNTVKGSIVDNSAAGGTVTLAKAGAGTWRLEGSSTFSGGVRINRGTLVVTSIGNAGGDSSLGSGALIRGGNQAYSGVLEYVGAGETSDKQFQIGSGTGVDDNGSLTILSNGAGGLTFSNDDFNVPETGLAATAPRVLTLGGSSAVVNEIKGVIRDNTALVPGGGRVGVVKEGAGTWVLSGVSPYTANTVVSQGTLLVDGALTGSGGVNVQTSATLGGRGSIAGTTDVSGVLSPGAAGGTGVLSLATLRLASTSLTHLDIRGSVRGSEYDGIDIDAAGGLTYGGLLDLAFGQTFTRATTFLLFNHVVAEAGGFTGVQSTGAYAGIWAPAGHGTFRLDAGDQSLTFDQSTGMMTIVPEPGSSTLGVVAIATFAAHTIRRHRRRRLTAPPNRRLIVHRA